jgi:hypothetical protein
MRTLEQIIAEHPFWKGLNPHYFPLSGDCPLAWIPTAAVAPNTPLA